MKIEVFKELERRGRFFDAVNPTYVSWMFNSENHRDGENAPPFRNGGFVNELAPYAEDLPDTIYFDSISGEYKLYSTQRNVVIDCSKPRLLNYTGTFTAFNSTEREWNLEILLKDDSGIDSGAFKIWTDGGNLYRSSRKNSQSPDYPPIVDRIDAVRAEFVQSPVDKTLYKINITIDPNNSSISSLLKSCNEDANFKYLKLHYQFFDIAGNSIDNASDPIIFLKYDISEDALISEISKLKLSFVDTYPESMFVDSDTIGKTTAVAVNTNTAVDLYGFKTKIGLLNGSVGYLSGIATVDDTDSHITTQVIDGIDHSGYVKAYAYLDGEIDNIECEISGDTIAFNLDKDIAARIRAATYVEAELGPFISECSDNKRKLSVEPFIPGVLKNEKIYGLCKLFERYLNTMYTPFGGDCRIGILEKVHRISEFKNPDACEARLLPKFAEEHGSELIFNYEDVKEAAGIIAKYEDENVQQTTEQLTDAIYRRYYSILPYVDRWKGTSKSIELLYRVIGISAYLVPLWEGPTHDLLEESAAGSDYRLTSHLRLILESDLYSIQDMKKLSNFALKAVKSILPVNRVISEVRTRDKYNSDENKLFLFNISTTIDKSPSKPEKISFAWKCRNLISISSDMSNSTFDIAIPMYADHVEVGHDVKSGWSVPDSCAFYFTRLREMLRTYKKPFSVYFSTALLAPRITSLGTDIGFDVSGIKLSRERVILTCQKSSGYNGKINAYNTNLLSTAGYMAVSFKFSRAVDDYCMPIPLSEYASLDALDVPYEVANG